MTDDTAGDAPILLDERTTSHHYSIPIRTLQAWRQRGGGIPYLKIGRSVRYDRRVVEAYLIECARRSTSDDTAREAD